jgi:hypothetical protein
MWDSIWPSGSDVETLIAAAVTLAAASATVMLFCATLVLRLATIRNERRRQIVIDRWRGIFAAALLSEHEAQSCKLPRYRNADRRHLLDEWNRIRSTVDGESVTSLVLLAGRLELAAPARRMLRRRKVTARLLALQTLGHLGDASEWQAIEALTHAPNTALAATAALALVQIDAPRAAPEVMSELIRRADWPPGAVFRILKTAGPALITQQLCNAILTSEPATSIRLLRYSELAWTEAIDRLVEVILRERDEPAVLAAALKAVSSQASVPRLAMLARHEAWYVRVQAATLLGRVGEERDLPLLETLLRDGEWWVRYRAAQAIVQLPFMGPNALRRTKERQRDRYAAQMMEQAMAEVGL